MRRVLDGVAALVVVDVVGLAVGQQQQQAVALGARLEQRRAWRMAAPMRV